MIIRSGVMDDIPWLSVELRQFAEFYKVPQLFPDDETARVTLAEYVERKVLFVAASEGRPIGFIAGEVKLHEFNADFPLLVEHFWWVCKEHRGGRAGLLLLDEFHRFADAHGYMVAMSLLPASPIGEHTLTKRGYRLAEKTYLRNPSDTNRDLKEVA